MVVRIGLKGAKPVKTYFREWRDWKGWSQEELADRMETTTATISRVESGDRDWGKGFLEAFSYVVGCPNISDPITRPPGAPITLDDMLRDATPEQRRQAFVVVEALLRTGTDG
jgi:transcriptional regulator with XRE-family HTH domain